MYGLKQFSDSVNVRELLRVVTKKVKVSKDIFDGQAIANILYGLQNLNSDSPEVRYFLQVMSEKISKCEDFLTF